MSVLKIKGADGEWVGVTAIQGEQGEDGFSPLINVNTNTSSTYKLRIQTIDKDFITPNLKGQGGSGGSGNISSELGTIDNYKDFEGKFVPTYNTNMPPLQCFEGGTTYVFDHEVTMLVYNGAIDDNGNTNIDDYISYTGTEITVPTTYYGTLTDYLIYNAAPKKDWDTWKDPNIINFLKHDDPKFFRTHTRYNKTYVNRDFTIPNLKIMRDVYGRVLDIPPFKQGDAYIAYSVFRDKSDNWYTKKGEYDLAVYHTEDFPFVLDEPVMYYDYNASQKEYTKGVEIPYPGAQWEKKKDYLPAFKRGVEYAVFDGLDLSCCNKNGEVTGNDVLMGWAEHEQEVRAKEEVDRAWEMIVVDPYYVNGKLSKHNAKPIAPVMYVGLEPLKNYTIETLAGDCALFLTNPNPKYHITTQKETVCYPTTTKTAEVGYRTAKDVGVGNASGAVGGTAYGGSDMDSGAVITYDYIDTTKDPVGKIDVPCALSCPQLYLKKGESYTFQVEDEDAMWGICIMCWQEEDYQGIKIVEGIEPYSLLMEERMASGATKFNVKSYWTPEVDLNVDTNQIMQEFNIKLADNAGPNEYCRFLNTDTIKHFDLDEFSMNGHIHGINDLKDINTFVESLSIPKMVLSTSTLADGESELAENTFYFVYEE